MILDRPAPPVIVIVGMREPVEEVRRERGRRVELRHAGGKRKEWIRTQGQFPDAVQGIGVLRDETIKRILREPGRPRFVEPLLKGTALIRPVAVIVAGRDNRANTRKMRRMRDGG